MVKVPANELRKTMESVGFADPEVVTFGFTDQGRYFVRSKTQSLLSKASKQKIRASVEKASGQKIILWDASQETGTVFESGLIRHQLLTRSRLALLMPATKMPASTSIPARQIEFDLRFSGVRGAIVAAMNKSYGDKFDKINQLTSVGSAVGKQMRNQGVLSVIYALLGILLYVSFGLTCATARALSWRWCTT